MTKNDQIELCQTISPCINDNRSEKSSQVEKNRSWRQSVSASFLSETISLSSSAILSEKETQAKQILFFCRRFLCEKVV